MTLMTPGDSRWRLAWKMVVVFGPLAVASAYLVWKSLDPAVSGVDFKYLWFAGLLWAEGTSPYGPHYQERAAAFFVGTNVPTWMVYPPSWYPLGRALAVLPLASAERLWGVLSGAMIVAGGLLVARAVWPLRRRDAVWPLAAFGVFLGMGSATAVTLSLGQTASLIFVGAALFLHGFVTKSRVVLGVALVVLMLKPNVGLPFVAFTLVWPGLWPAVAGAGVVSVVAALPALLPYGLGAVLRAYAELLGRYGGDPVNAPPSLTGVVNLTHHLVGVNLGGFLTVGVAVVLALGLGVWLRLNEAGAESPYRARLGAVLALSACVVLLVPMHTYDLLLAAPILLLPLVARARWGPVTLVTLACFLVIFRANNLAGATGLTSPDETYFAGSGIASVALVGLFLASWWNVLAGRGGGVAEPSPENQQAP